MTSLGSAIFAFCAAKAFNSIEEAQKQICPPHIVYKPQPETRAVYDKLYGLYKRLYFDFGQPRGSVFGDVLPALIEIASEQAQKGASAS